MTKKLAIVGPTGVGKSLLACQIAIKLGGEIINTDSRQVYRGMDIGTGKDLKEYNRLAQLYYEEEQWALLDRTLEKIGHWSKMISNILEKKEMEC